MGVEKKKVEIEGIWIDKISGAVRKTVSTLKSFKKGVQTIITETEKFGKSGVQTTRMIKTIKQPIDDIKRRTNKLGEEYNTFGKVIGMPIEKWKKFNKEGGKFTNVGAKAGNRVRQLTHGMRGFRMEMLGVMFFGMAMNRFFMGLLNPALKMAGVFDILNITLGVFFLPIALFLLKLLMPLASALMDASEATQMFWGFMVLLGAGIGGAWFLIGQFALGIGSIILAFGGLSTLGLVWPNIFGKAAFASALTGMKGKFATFLKTLKFLAVAAVIIKTAFDLKAFAEGEKTLMQTVKSLGINLALLGFVFKQPWMIVLGILPQLLPMGTKIEKMGKAWIQTGKAMMSVGEGAEALERIWSRGAGFATWFAGGAVGLFGATLDEVNDYIDSFDDAREKAEALQTAQGDLVKMMLSGRITMDQFKEGMANLSFSMKVQTDTFASLHEQFNAGEITAEQLQQRLSKLNGEFATGTDKMEEYSVSLSNVLDLYAKAREAGTDANISGGELSGEIPGIGREYTKENLGYADPSVYTNFGPGNVSVNITTDTDQIITQQ